MESVTVADVLPRVTKVGGVSRRLSEVMRGGISLASAFKDVSDASV